MALQSGLDVFLTTELSKTQGLGPVSQKLPNTFGFQWPDGTGANAADRVFQDRRTLAASANEDLDLAGVLLDPFGAAITFARVKAIFVKASAANTNNVVIGGAAATQFVGGFGAATHTFAVQPGGLFLVVAPGATAWPVGAGTSDFLRITNSGAGTSVTYDVVIIGASA
jgi:hypothetical protein